MVQFAVTGILSVAVAIGSDVSLAVRSSHAFWAIVFLAVFPTVSAFLIQALAQRHTSPIKVALIFSLEPVVAALFAWTWGGEAFLMQSAAGGGLIVSGMILSALPKPKAV